MPRSVGLREAVAAAPYIPPARSESLPAEDGRGRGSRSMRLSEVEPFLIKHTERYLTWRKRRKLTRKAKQKRKNQILDWVQALLWAAVVVLILNQYLIQAYAVPSGSMEDTILGGDRLFVDKLVYGPEARSRIRKAARSGPGQARRHRGLLEPRLSKGDGPRRLVGGGACQPSPLTCSPSRSSIAT